MSLRRKLGLATLTLTLAFFAYDLVQDALFEGEFGSPHFVIEALVFALVSWTLVVNLRDLVGLGARLEHEQARNRILAGELANGIDAQMDEWKLTPSEREVAWLIIKGYRFAEVADIRGVKESTARLQATMLYGKAGVSGRAEFVAEVVHQLLMPIRGEPPSGEGRRTGPPRDGAAGPGAAVGG